MARTEEEDAPLPARETAAAAEHLTAFERAQKHQFIRLRDIEILPVHLLFGNLEDRRHALRDGVSGIDRPDRLAVVIAPAEGAGRSHEAGEYLRPVTGVQHHQS